MAPSHGGGRPLRSTQGCEAHDRIGYRAVLAIALSASWSLPRWLAGVPDGERVSLRPVVEKMIGAGRSSMAWMFSVLDRAVCATSAWLRD
jgi:hypothetical protein